MNDAFKNTFQNFYLDVFVGLIIQIFQKYAPFIFLWHLSIDLCSDFPLLPPSSSPSPPQKSFSIFCLNKTSKYHMKRIFKDHLLSPRLLKVVVLTNQVFIFFFFMSLFFEVAFIYIIYSFLFIINYPSSSFKT